MGAGGFKIAAVGIAQIQRHCVPKSVCVNSWCSTHFCGPQHPASSTTAYRSETQPSIPGKGYPREHTASHATRALSSPLQVMSHLRRRCLERAGGQGDCHKGSLSAGTFLRKRGLGDLCPTAGQFCLMLWTVGMDQAQTASSILFS